jgi:hypothetical protein
MTTETKEDTRPKAWHDADKIAQEKAKFREKELQLDGLIGELDSLASDFRNKARSIGSKLSLMKNHDFESPAHFEVWFTKRYRRTIQTARQWMRLDDVWHKAESIHTKLTMLWDEAFKAAQEADPNLDAEKWKKEIPPPRAWDTLGVDDTLDLVRKWKMVNGELVSRKKIKDEDEEGEGTDKGDKVAKPTAVDLEKQLAEARKQLAVARKELERAKSRRWGGGEAEMLAEFRGRNAFHEVPNGVKVRIGKELISVDRPVLLVPGTKVEMPMATLDVHTTPAE